MAAPMQPKDQDLIQTWPNAWTQIHHPPAYPELVSQLKEAAKKADRQAIETLKKEPS